MCIAEARNLAAIAGVAVGATSLVLTAINTRLAQQANRARFWLDLRAQFSRHDAVHRKLRIDGEWTSGGLGPTTPEEWADVASYLGLFEHCEILLREGLIDAPTFMEIYCYRLENILANDSIREEKIIGRAEKWTQLRALVNRMELKIEGEASA
jgi:hypothetical protein